MDILMHIYSTSVEDRQRIVDRITALLSENDPGYSSNLLDV